MIILSAYMLLLFGILEYHTPMHCTYMQFLISPILYTFTLMEKNLPCFLTCRILLKVRTLDVSCLRP